jgi:hypothetical protein
MIGDDELGVDAELPLSGQVAVPEPMNFEGLTDFQVIRPLD